MKGIPARWFEDAMRDGLGRMLLLSLDGRPPEDTAAEMFDQWIDDLWASRDWLPVDADRIATAFQRLRVSADRWPTIPRFVETLQRIDRPKDAVPALPPPAKEGENPAADACFAELRQLFGIIKQTGGTHGND
jgi:hypothetical protein